MATELEQYDAIIIGAGQAGPPLAGRLTSAGKKVVLIEREHVGGTCVNTGCIPTKTLVASARAAHVARRAGDFGVVLEGAVRVDMSRVKARKDQVSLASRDGVTKWLEGMEGLTFLRGHARFVEDRKVAVGDRVLLADRVFVNTGARAKVPAFSTREGLWTNKEMMEVDFLPDHLVIVGGGYIGLEFSQMYRRFGARVTVVERGSRLLPGEDEEVGGVVKSVLEREGVHFRFGAECIDVKGSPGAFEVQIECSEDSSPIPCSHVLVATGRTPNTDELGLENTTVQLDDRGYIVVDETLMTTAEGVFAIGEVNGQGGFTHTSYNDFEIVAENLLDGAARRVSDRFLTYGMFVDPPLARVGMNESQARASGKKVLKARYPMNRVGRAREKGETDGFMSILVDAENNRLLGATILGPGGDEAVHAVTDLMYAQVSVETLRRAVHIHPTVAELLPTLAGQLEPLR